MAEEKKEEKVNKELEKEGKKVLGGPIIYFWVLSVITGIAVFSFNSADWANRSLWMGPVSIGFPSANVSWIVLALFIVALVGLYIRKAWAVPVGRAGLVVSMVIFFPVGTIFGAILWKRYNDPISKMYLDYPLTDEEKEQAKVLESKEETKKKDQK
jgi:hypothetical protein